MKGIVIKNSLQDESVLANYKVVREWETGNWRLCEIEVDADQIEQFTGYLDDGPWYIHFWDKDGDVMYVAYKDKLFAVSKSDQDTRQAAIDYGLSISIPSEQLTFPTD